MTASCWARLSPWAMAGVGLGGSEDMRADTEEGRKKRAEFKVPKAAAIIATRGKARLGE